MIWHKRGALRAPIFSDVMRKRLAPKFVMGKMCCLINPAQKYVAALFVPYQKVKSAFKF
jgi:hypothetical protein